MAKSYFFKSQPNIAGTGRTGGYVTADAERCAGNRIDRRLAKWLAQLAEWSDGGTAEIELRRDPRGRVLVARFAGEAVQP